MRAIGRERNRRLPDQNRSIAPTLRTTRCLSLRDIGTLSVKIPDAHRYRRGRNILSERSDDVR